MIRAILSIFMRACRCIRSNFRIVLIASCYFAQTR